MSAQSPQSKARYVPDDRLTSPIPSDARIAFIPADGDDGTEDYGVAADLGTGGGGQTLVIANDEDITVAASPGTTLVLYKTLTATRTVTLPPASSASMTIVVADVNGNATDLNQIAINPVGMDSGGQLISGTFNADGEAITIVNDSVSAWYATSQLMNWLTNVFAEFLGDSFPLRTSDPHVVGQLWNNAGVVNVSAG